MYNTINTKQYTIKISGQSSLLLNKDQETLKKSEPLIESETYGTIRDAFVNEKTIEKVQEEEEEDTGSFCGTMIVNESVLEQDSLEQVGILKTLMHKEIASLDKGGVTSLKEALKGLSRQDIEQRLAMVDGELKSTVESLTLKYAKNKERILNAIIMKKKNRQIF